MTFGYIPKRRNSPNRSLLETGGMCGNLIVGAGIQGKDGYPPAKRLADPVCQVEGGRTAGEDVDGAVVEDQFERQPDIFDALRFVNDQQPALANDHFQSVEVCAPEQLLDEGGFPRLSWAIQQDDFGFGAQFLLNIVK